MRKREAYFIFMIFTLFLSAFLIESACALSFDMKSEYSAKETMIVAISGSILEPIVKGDITFKRGHVALPVEFDVKKIGEKYYIWAIAPENANNYTIEIKDVTTYAAGKIASISYEINFSVSGELADYYIKPGFVYTKESFEIIAWLNEDNEKEISVDFPEEKSITIKPGENIIKFNIEESGARLTNITIGKYTIPAYIIGEGVSEEASEISVLRFSPARIKSAVFESSKPEYEIKLMNEGAGKISNVSLDYNKNLFAIAKDSGIEIEANSTFAFNISLKNNLSSNISEMIYAKYGKDVEDLKIEISITKDANKTSTRFSEANATIKRYCLELSGKICTADRNCLGDSILSLDGNCCLGTCVEKQVKPGSKSWIGYFILIILIAVAVFLGYRYFKAGKMKNALENRIALAEKMMRRG